MSQIRETELYAPIKTFLVAQGYEVKGEVGAADIVASNGEDAPIIVELKTGFSLSLIHQAIARQAVTDAVYVAVPYSSTKQFQASLKNNKALCRRLGLGLMTVRLRDKLVTVHVDPAPYKPRKSAVRTGRLLREFAKRVGDPNAGGSTRKGLITAYRQDALRCVKILSDLGPTKASEVAKLTGVATARRIMADDHYGWFERPSTGIYQLTPKGVGAIKTYRAVLSDLSMLVEAA